MRGLPVAVHDDGEVLERERRREARALQKKYALWGWAGFWIAGIVGVTAWAIWRF